MRTGRNVTRRRGVVDTRCGDCPDFLAAGPARRRTTVRSGDRGDEPWDGRYLISFDDGAMTFPDEDMPEVAEAAHGVVRQAGDAGVWVFGGGVASQRASVVGTDGTVTEDPYPETKAVVGGFAVVDVPSRAESLEWAAKIAAACRCAQAVRELLPDPEV